MKIGILGAGNIGGNLGRRWSRLGHTIRFGVRKPDDVQALVKECGNGASAGDVASTIEHGEVVAIALPWAAVSDLLKDGASAKGKVIIDATNALTWGADGPSAALATSAAETIAEAWPGARVVKAFNTLGAEHLLNPIVGGAQADAFLCADDAEAKAITKKLVEDIGFRALDLGPLKNARVAENIAIAWIYLSMKAGLGRNVAFKLVGGD
jgi:8-hydroxy-5-deazaflavin:NADPH oxidoreductase